MNRQTLSDATSLHDAAVPIYLMQEIAAGTKASERDAEKTVDFLLGRLSKTNLIVKLKALQIISFCIREGDPVFADIIREEESEITPYLQYSGPPDPVMGDERYRRIRVASQEVIVCLNDGVLPRRNDPPPAQQQQPQSPAPYSDAPPQNAYGNSGNVPYGQSGGYGGPSQSSGPWGNNSGSSAASRPAPYSDGPAGPSYGGPQQGQYGGQHNGGYGQNNNQNPGYGGGYGNDASQQHQQQQHHHQASGLGSWSNPAAAPAYGAPKAAGGGMWSNAGYQKSAAPPPAYGGGSSFSSRDTRPTVLVGHNLNFPKAPSHGNSSLIGGVSGTGSGAYGGPSASGGAYGGPSGSTYGGQGAGGYGGASGPGGYGNNGGGYGGNSGGNMGGNSGFGGAPGRQTPSYVENMNRMLSSNGSVGFSGGMQGPNGGPTTKLGKAVVGLKKISVEAKDRWDRRNMDKSIGASLADHDELNAGPTVMDRGYFQPHSMQQGTGGKDTSGEYERSLIDSLCASVGLARAPPADALKRFVDLAQTLDVQTIGDILLDKLEDSVWQVRLKALHVVLALLESPGAAPYLELFEDNAGVFEELQGDAKPTVASKAQQVLRALGLVDENAPEPRRQTARATPSRPSAQQNSGEVDFLGFEGLSINSASQPAQAPAPLNIYGSPASAPAPAPAHHAAPEISLLDGFDLVPQHPAPQQYHQQHQQQAYHQQQPNLLSPRQQHQPQQQQQQSIYGDLLLQSPPQQPMQVPADDRSKTLSNFGKDLFTIANSPRGGSHNDGAAPANPAERSAFNFM